MSNVSTLKSAAGRKINWALTFGLVLVGIMVFLALFGPSLAQQNPIKENYALKVNGLIRTPPYPAFEIPGYPLGTDRYGRDLLSRILWAVRPTLLMVVSVAGVRLSLGLILGLIIGWSTGRQSRILDSLLSVALSIPVLISSLIGIFIIGIDHGLWAFIFGLGLTGWAETARLVSEQTRIIKNQTFIEAAHALGASDRRVLYMHVIRQIAPLLWMLLAFEISSTLLVSAELGFLGYYIGGGIWVEVSDFAAVNVEGLPELGQMIHSSLVKLTDPFPLVIVGSVICAGVLGFNLLGEGLRLRMSQEWLRGGRRFKFLSETAEEWLDVRVIQPVGFWFEAHRITIWVTILLFALAAGAWKAYDTFTVRLLPDTNVSMEETPSEHLWASERHDPYGTLWVPVSMDNAPTLLWTFPIPGGPSGRPAVKSDGTIFIAAKDKTLWAINPDGSLKWEAALDEEPVGGPAIGNDSHIFVADKRGAVTAFDAGGNRIWRAQASSGREATSGPITDAKGNVYLTSVDTVCALTSEGKLLWRVQAADTYLEEAPRLSPDQSLVFLKNTAIRTETGAVESLAFADPQELLFTDPTFFSGANGSNYYRLGHEIIGWHFEGTDLKIDSRQTWVHDGTVLLLPYDQGVTKDGLTWFYYSMQFAETNMIWLDAQSRVVGNTTIRLPDPRLAAIGGKGEAIICGSVTVKVTCVNISPGVENPTWEVSVESPAPYLGGALVPGRLYLSLGDGLYALGD
jgi:ABC-type dipeptide/oligopeptide/nickel transport system permease subunit/outer membrane protein assembly factor BamB